MSEDEEYPEWAKKDDESEPIRVETEDGIEVYAPPIGCEYCDNDAVAVVIREYQGAKLHGAVCEEKLQELEEGRVDYEFKYL